MEIRKWNEYDTEREEVYQLLDHGDLLNILFMLCVLVFEAKFPSKNRTFRLTTKVLHIS